MVIALAFSARSLGFDLRGRRGKISVSEHAFLNVICRDDTKCAVLRIGTLNGGPLCREGYPLCRLKNPTVVYMITCRLSSCKTDVYNVHLLIILERECTQLTSLRCYNVVLTLQYGHENVVNNVVSLFSRNVFLMCTQRCQTTFHITFSQPSCNIF